MNGGGPPEGSVSMRQARIRTIDLARGAAVALMILYNWSVTLSYFGLFRPPQGIAWSFGVPALIAGAFIFLSGAVARLSFESGRAGFARRYFRRGAKLVLFAAAVTVFTSVFVPQGAVFFGILHFFAVTSFLIPFLVGLGGLNLVGGLAAIAAGAFLMQLKFGFGWLFWLGLAPDDFFTFDYFPLLPWLGMLMLGMHFGKGVARKAAAVKMDGMLAVVFEFLGRHSLEAYLVHQPLLIILLAALGFKTF